MAKRLATNVVLTSPNGGTVTYRAGSTPPGEVADRITNPDAWAAEDSETEPTPTPSPAPAVNPPNPPSPPTPPSDSGSGTAGEEPARNGTTEAWKSYAEGLGQTVEGDAGRDAIIAQLVAAGLIKE